MTITSVLLYIVFISVDLLLCPFKFLTAMLRSLTESLCPGYISCKCCGGRSHKTSSESPSSIELDELVPKPTDALEQADQAEDEWPGCGGTSMGETSSVATQALVMQVESEGKLPLLSQSHDSSTIPVAQAYPSAQGTSRLASAVADVAASFECLRQKLHPKVIMGAVRGAVRRLPLTKQDRGGRNS